MKEKLTLENSRILSDYFDYSVMLCRPIIAMLDRRILLSRRNHIYVGTFVYLFAQSRPTTFLAVEEQKGDAERRVKETAVDREDEDERDVTKERWLLKVQLPCE